MGKDANIIKVLGIDPGSRFTGWGIIERQIDGSNRHLASGVLKLPLKENLGKRLVYLAEKLEEILKQHQPQQGAIEGVFIAHHPRSALILGQARGVALCTLMRANLQINEYSPSQIKKCVSGNGSADKPQIQRMVQLLLGLPVLPNQDQADALAVAITNATMICTPHYANQTNN